MSLRRCSAAPHVLSPCSFPSGAHCSPPANALEAERGKAPWWVPAWGASCIPHPSQQRGGQSWGGFCWVLLKARLRCHFEPNPADIWGLGCNPWFGVDGKLPTDCSSHWVCPWSSRVTQLILAPPLSSTGQLGWVGLLMSASVCRIRLHEFTYFRTHSKCKNTKERGEKKRNNNNLRC